MATVDAFLTKRGEDYLSLSKWISLQGDDEKVALALIIAFQETKQMLPLYWRTSVIEQSVPERLPQAYTATIWADLLTALGNGEGWPDFLPPLEGHPERYCMDLLVSAAECDNFCKVSGLDNPLKPKPAKRQFPLPANWDFWKKSGRFAAGELVWLSFGYEPYEGPVKSDIRNKWKERFDLLSRNVFADGDRSFLLTPRHEMKPGVFVDVAKTLQWELPDDFYLLRMGDGYSKKDQGATNAAELSEREKNTLLNIIGGLLGLMLSPGPTGRSRSGYDGQAAIIEAMLAHYPDAKGLSKRNLEKHFAAAKRNIDAG